MVESREGRDWPKYRAPDPSGVPARQRRVRAEIEDLEDGFGCDGLCNLELQDAAVFFFLRIKKKGISPLTTTGASIARKGDEFQAKSIAGGDPQRNG